MKQLKMQLLRATKPPKSITHMTARKQRQATTTFAKTGYNDICKDILTAFENEKVNHDCRYRAGRVSKYNLFCDWMAGLATAFPVSNDIFLGSAVDWLADILEETEEEKDRYTEEKAESTACYLLYRELTKHAAKSKN